MSTQQATPPDRNSTRSRSGTAVVAGGVLIAIVVSTLFLSLTGAHRTATSATTSAHSHAASASVLSSDYERFLHYLPTPPRPRAHPAPAAITGPVPPGHFRDPATHKLLRIPVARKHTHRHPPNRSSGGVAP